MPVFADRAISFYLDLKIPGGLPEGVDAMNPYEDPPVQSILHAFFHQYYADKNKRVILLGINPGRLGAGITGVTFTDPVRLESMCGISNPFDKKSELSSRFIYDVIEAYGGTAPFFGRFFLSAVSPLGFIRGGKNLNYYDDPSLQRSLAGFIGTTLGQQCRLGIDNRVAICLGEGKNHDFLDRLNREAGYFHRIIPLPHPRWVMQYRFRQRADFVQRYLEALHTAAG